LLFEKRNITIHRTDPSVRDESEAVMTEKIQTPENVSYIVWGIRTEISNNNQIQERIKWNILNLQKILSKLNGFLKIILR
jgi:hypothetical protein